MRPTIKARVIDFFHGIEKIIEINFLKGHPYRISERIK